MTAASATCSPSATGPFRDRPYAPSSQADFGVGAFLLAACEYVRFLDRKAAVRQVPLTVVNDGDSQWQGIVESDAAAVRKALSIADGGASAAAQCRRSGNRRSGDLRRSPAHRRERAAPLVVDVLCRGRTTAEATAVDGGSGI